MQAQGGLLRGQRARSPMSESRTLFALGLPFGGLGVPNEAVAVAREEMAWAEQNLASVLASTQAGG